MNPASSPVHRASASVLYCTTDSVVMFHFHRARACVCGVAVRISVSCGPTSDVREVVVVLLSFFFQLTMVQVISVSKPYKY